MAHSDSQDPILTDARDRARVLLAALKNDAAALSVSERFADGAACCEDAAEQTRRLIGELDAHLDLSEGQPRL